MRIAFILPREYPYPVGGYKVVYEYANYLASQNDEVYILYSSSYSLGELRIIDKLRILKYYLLARKRKTFLSSLWFNLKAEVHETRIMSIDKYFLPKCDAYIATAIKTAVALNKIHSINNKKKFYFIQGFENWSVNGNDSLVYETYKYPMTKIVISNWLKRIMDEMNEEAFFIPNGFDFDFFQYSTPIEKRNRFHIAYMYHPHPLKGAEVAFQAFEKVKATIPELRITIFSAYDKPEGLPDWYDFYQQPNQALFNKIYNDAAIFVGSSNNEGWGLTIGEAMICGCAVVCTNNRGYLEMVVNEDNALVVPVGDSERMSDAIIRLIHDVDLRIRLAKNGHNSIQRFKWENSFKELRDVIHSIV